MAKKGVDEILAREELRGRLRRTDLIFSGGFGVATGGRLTDEGIDKLFDALNAAGVKLVYSS